MIKDYICNGCEKIYNRKCKIEIVDTTEYTFSDMPQRCIYHNDHETNWQEQDYTSISYLQSINQPFGTLREETQEALESDKYKGQLQYYCDDKWCYKSPDYAINPLEKHRLRPDYKEPSKGIDTLELNTAIMTKEEYFLKDKLNELIEVVNKLIMEQVNE